MGLSPAAETFRASLADPTASSSEFARWRAEVRPARLAAWAATAALMASGLATFLLQAPGWVSGALEVGGWVLGAWLRRARTARLAAVRAWEPDTAE